MSDQIYGKYEFFKAAGAFEFELAGEIAFDDEFPIDEVGACVVADGRDWDNVILRLELEDIVGDLTVESETFGWNFLVVEQDHGAAFLDFRASPTEAGTSEEMSPPSRAISLVMLELT